MSLRVVKVGGSLLERPGLPNELRSWLASQPAKRNVLVTGGGRLADAVRQLDRRGNLSPDAAHRLAIRAMSLWAWTLSQLEPAWPYRNSWTDLEASRMSADQSLTVVFDPAEFLRIHEANLSGTRLPIGWQVTSDSIAARIAEVLAAPELVLLKSTLSRAATVHAAAQAGYVDAHFPAATGAQPLLRCVDLPHDRQVIWQRGTLLPARPETTTTTDRRGEVSWCARRPRDA